MAWWAFARPRGRLARNPPAKIDDLLALKGPIARTGRDCALLFDAMYGADARDPVSRASPGNGAWRAATRSQWRALRGAYSADFGITPVDPEVAALTKKAALRLADVGVIVDEVQPDFTDGHNCFGRLRAYAFAATKAGLLVSHRNQRNPELIWNIEKELARTSADLNRAEKTHAQMYRNAAAFFPATICCGVRQPSCCSTWSRNVLSAVAMGLSF